MTKLFTVEFAADVQYSFANFMEGLPDVKVAETLEQLKLVSLPEDDFEENT